MTPRKAAKKAVLLVGHGAVPTDYPPALVSELKALEGRRRITGAPPEAREIELDQKIRRWLRTKANDPYQAGVEAIAKALRAKLQGSRVALAYNEFCAPDIEEAVAKLVGEGYRDVTLVPTMYTRGGVHSEVEIPKILEDLRRKHPGAKLRYAWPFPVGEIAALLDRQLRRFT